MGYFDWYKKVRETHKGRTIFNVHRSYYVISQLTPFITPFFIMRKISAMTVTYLRGFLGLASIFLVVWIEPARMNLAVIAILVFRLSDSIDGDIARVTNTSSMLGRYLDGFVDIVTESLFPLAFAYALYKTEPNVLYMALGGFLCFLSCLANLNIDRYSTFIRWIRERERIDIEMPLFSKRGRMVTNFFTDLWYLSIITTAFNLKMGVVSLLCVVFIWSSFNLVYFMRLVYGKIKGFPDKPKVHAV